MTASEVGIIAARVVPGALAVDAAALAEHLGVQAPAGLQQKRITDVDETGVTLALDAALDLVADAGVRGGDVQKVVLAGGQEESAEVEPILRAALDNAALDILYTSDDAAAGLAALDAALEAARSGHAPALVIAMQGTTRVRAATHAVPVARAAAAAALLVGPGAVAVPQDAAALPSVPAAWGDLGPAGPLCALLEVAADAPPGTSTGAWRVVETPRWLAPSRVLAAAKRSVEPAVAVRIADAWTIAGEREPRGAYVPIEAFRRHAPARYRIEGQQCGDCKRLLFPPRERCPECGTGALAPYRFSGRAEVYASTRIGAAGAPSEFAPHGAAVGAYRVAVVQLEEGPRVAAMLTGADVGEVKVGDAVRLVTRLVYVQEGVARYSFKGQRV